MHLYVCGNTQLGNPLPHSNSTFSRYSRHPKQNRKCRAPRSRSAAISGEPACPIGSVGSSTVSRAKTWASLPPTTKSTLRLHWPPKSVFSVGGRVFLSNRSSNFISTAHGNVLVQPGSCVNWWTDCCRHDELPWLVCKSNVTCRSDFQRDLFLYHLGHRQAPASSCGRVKTETRP